MAGTGISFLNNVIFSIPMKITNQTKIITIDPTTVLKMDVKC